MGWECVWCALGARCAVCAAQVQVRGRWRVQVQARVQVRVCPRKQASGGAQASERTPPGERRHARMRASARAHVGAHTCVCPTHPPPP